jgi:hypothetical protein
VKCWLDGDIIAAGPILKPRFDMQARQVSVPFFGDPSYRLEKSFVNNRGDTDFNTGTGILGTLNDQGQSTFTQVDQAQILPALIDHASPTALELSLGVPDNGIAFGTLQSGGVLRDRTYETGAQIYQQIVDMSGVIDGIDFSFTPQDRTDGVLARSRRSTRSAARTSRPRWVRVRHGARQRGERGVGAGRRRGGEPRDLPGRLHGGPAAAAVPVEPGGVAADLRHLSGLCGPLGRGSDDDAEELARTRRGRMRSRSTGSRSPRVG